MGCGCLAVSYTHLIASGEIAVVRRVRRTREIYGFRFTEVTLRFPDPVSYTHLL